MDVQELVGLVPWTFVAQICNLFIQMYLIKRFLFKPVGEMLEKRRALADAQIREAEQAKADADAIKTEYEQNMKEAKEKANEILTTAQRTAALQSEEVLKEAASQALDTALPSPIPGPIPAISASPAPIAHPANAIPFASN